MKTSWTGLAAPAINFHPDWRERRWGSVHLRKYWDIFTHLEKKQSQQICSGRCGISYSHVLLCVMTGFYINWHLTEANETASCIENLGGNLNRK